MIPKVIEAEYVDDMSYPTPRCFRQAIEFLEINQKADDWHLHIEVFDPHEPFDSPPVYRDLYEDDWDGYLFNWPSYDKLDPELDTPDVVTHIRKRYAATLSMANAETGVFLNTTHGVPHFRFPGAARGGCSANPVSDKFVGATF